MIIVSSGSIALGCKKLNLNKKKLKLDKSQAVAFNWSNRVDEFISKCIQEIKNKNISKSF